MTNSKDINSETEGEESLKYLKKKLEKLKKKKDYYLKNYKENGHKNWLKKKVPGISKKHNIRQRQAYRFLLEKKELLTYLMNYKLLNIEAGSLGEDLIIKKTLEEYNDEKYVNYRIKNTSLEAYLQAKMNIFVEIEDYNAAAKVRDKIKELK